MITDGGTGSNAVLITGGAGFIGTNLVMRLLERGATPIRVLDDFSNPSGDLPAHEHIEVLRGDILDAQRVDQALDGVRLVVHLASHTRVVESLADPIHNMRVNVVGTLNVLEGMRRRDIRRIINASTGGAIVGDVPPPVHEEVLPKPVSPYGASKLAVEGYLSAYAGSYGMQPLSLRFSNIYGLHSRNKGSVVAHFIKAILRDRAITIYGDGSQTRDFLYVQDLCDGIIAAMDSPVSGVMQLGSGMPTSVNELVDILRDIVPGPFKVTYRDFRPGEVRHTHCDITRARHGIGFRPSVSLRDGTRLAWDWFRSITPA